MVGNALAHPVVLHLYYIICPNLQKTLAVQRNFLSFLICKGGIVLDLNLREAILSNIASNDQSQLEATIVDAVQSGEEKMLPGLGVLFELIWENAEEQDKDHMLEALEQGVKQATTQS